MTQQLIRQQVGGRSTAALRRPDRRQTRGQTAGGSSGAGRGGHMPSQRKRTKTAVPTPGTPLSAAMAVRCRTVPCAPCLSMQWCTAAVPLHALRCPVCLVFDLSQLLAVAL